MSNDEIAIELKGVSKSFALPHEKTNSLKQLVVHPTNLFKSNTTSQLALSDISFKIKKGEFFGVVGKNGSGKSTLLKILAGIYHANEGEVTVNGSLMPFIELGVGFNPDLTGRENVFLSGALLGFSNSEMLARYDAIVSFAEIEEFMDQKLKNYSSGMQVRLAFSIATQIDTDIFLIDEVLAVGDTAFQRKCYDYFNKLKREKKTVVFITHEMDAIRKYCDRAMLISDSVIQEIGSVERITVEYEKLNQRKALSKKVVDESDKSSRWGDGFGKIQDAVSAKDIYLDGESIEISTNFEAVTDLDGVTIGIGVHDEQGRALTGTNTDLLGAKLGDIKAGTTTKVSWKIDQIFNDGEYDVSVELKHNNGISDSWPNATRFGASRTKKTGYLISPSYEVDIDDKTYGSIRQKVTASASAEKTIDKKDKQEEAPDQPTPVATTGMSYKKPLEPGVINSLQSLNESIEKLFKKKQKRANLRKYKQNNQKYEIENLEPAELLRQAKSVDMSVYKTHEIYKRWIIMSFLIGGMGSAYKLSTTTLIGLMKFLLGKKGR